MKTYKSLLVRYLLQIRWSLAAFCGFTALWVLLLCLYHTPAEPILYALGLSALIGVIFLGIRFYRFCRMTRLLTLAARNVSLPECTLPAPEPGLEQLYQQIISALRRLLREAADNHARQRQESLDYYTTWVHQVKVPIAVMRMLLQREDTEEHQQLQAELFRIEQYVEMVLTYFRLEGPDSDLLIREYSLDAILRQVIRKYAAQFVHKRIRLIYEGTGVTVLTDEKWLSFLIGQLLSNAVKYTESGSVKITVDERKRLTISDTGIGIAPEDLPRIFEKGYTGYNGRADKKATGLGLYLCKKISKRLNCPLTAESQVGKGSAFTLDLSVEPLAIE